MFYLQNSLVISGAWFAYGLLHSVLASLAVKRDLEPWLGRWYRLFYNIVAGITLLPVLALIPLLPNQILYHVDFPWAIGLILIQLGGLMGAGITLLNTGLSRFLGVAQLTQSAPLPPNTLQISGAYRWVRHPLYFFSLIFLWFSPTMSFNQLLSTIGITLYFYIGAIFEERKLLAQFGHTYGTYQHQVPMLIPFKFKR